MRIGIFIRLMAGRAAGGPETYEVQLIRALAAIDRENEYVVYCTGPYAQEAIAVQQPNFRYRVLAPSFRPLSVGLTLPALLMRDGLDFFHATFTPPPLCTRPLLFTVHCLSSIERPESYARLTALRLNALLRKGIRAARLITCVSEATRRHVHQVFGTPEERMIVTYNGVGPQFAPVEPVRAREIAARATGSDEPYMLYVGKLQAHKNVAGIVEAYHHFRRETGSATRLVIAGGAAGGYTGVEEAIERLELRDHVTRLGYVDAACIPALYSAARMFVFPSFWEGFGIPVVEAMACGAPVITSNVACLPEVAGDAALLVNPNKPAEIAEAMHRLDTSAELRSDLSARGAVRARVFTWENCARATLAGYRRMAA